jgi:HEXXH motif-containing protein
MAPIVARTYHPGVRQATLPAGFLALPADGAPEKDTHKLTHKLRLLALRRLLLVEESEVEPRAARALVALQQLLRQLAASEGRELVAAIGGIDVLAPLLCIEGGLVPARTALPALVPTLLLGLGPKAGALRETLLWDVPIERILDVERGVVIDLSPPARGLTFDPTGVELRTEDGTMDAKAVRDGGSVRVTTCLYRIVDGVRLSLCDSNPLAMLEEHPDKTGNAVDLGGRDADAWCAALREAFALIELALPTLAREIAGTLQRIVPVGYEPERHLSASYREAPGLAYLTLHPSPLTLAEAIVHESQHGKLNTLRWLDPVLENGDATWTSSPVRPDMRPLMGVLMAVHAFVPVAALHQRLRELDHPLADPERRAQVIAGNADGLVTLRELAKPTALGKRVIAALEELHAATSSA